MPAQQTYSSHTRWYPLFHFVVMPLLLIVLVWNVVLLYQEPSWNQAVRVLFAVTVILLGLASRLMALKAQDRVIRLEERLRHQQLLSDELLAKATGLSVGQIIALRFAPDDELPSLIEKTLNGEFAGNKEIKMAVKNWRPDYHRV
jgi:Family of unknown function (DUF6526)